MYFPLLVAFRIGKLMSAGVPEGNGLSKLTGRHLEVYFISVFHDRRPLMARLLFGSLLALYKPDEFSLQRYIR